MRVLEATVTWKSEANGCLEAPFSGIQPSFAVAGEFIMSRVESLEGFEKMDRGSTYRVRIVLPYGEHFEKFLKVGEEIKLYVGERLIATGIILRLP